jgi:hypothetical protein
MSDVEAKPTRLWTGEELATAVTAYLSMLMQQIEGKQVSKAAVIRDLQRGGLHRRSAKSIGRRMSNISSVLYERKLPLVLGYTPLMHVGSAVKLRITESLIRGGVDRIAAYAATDDQIELAHRVATLRNKHSALFHLAQKCLVRFRQLALPTCVIPP